MRSRTHPSEFAAFLRGGQGREIQGNGRVQKTWRRARGLQNLPRRAARELASCAAVGSPAPPGYALAFVTTTSVGGLLDALTAATAQAPVALGRYDVVGRLGRGGMSTVYEALDRDRQTRVALKTLSVADAAAAVSLKREFRIVADLAHPNLAPVFELAQDQGIWFFTMERVEGVSLTQWVRGDAEQSTAERSGVQLPLSRTLESLDLSGALDTSDSELSEWSRPGGDAKPGEVAGQSARADLEDDTVVETGAGQFPAHTEHSGAPRLPICDMATIRRVFGQLTLGIAALHEAGLRHGDIKPANVLVRPDGQAVLVDFGLARPLDERRAPMLVGTPTYMAPEQLSDSSVGPQADWYALGATLYGMLTGWKPFLAATALELYLKKMHFLPPPPNSLLPEIPTDLSDLALALLNPDPEGRPGKDALMRAFAGDSTPEVSTESVRGRLFVGRDKELCALEQAYGSACAGRVTVAHVHGPSGIGKSALLTSFLSAVQEVDSALVLRGRCYERERVPYKGFDRIIDELAVQLRQLSDSAVETMLPTYTGALARVFPALGSVNAIARRAAKEVITEGAIEMRHRAWVGLGELLQAFGKQRTVVLTIDDLQWSDADSAQLLMELLGHGRSSPLLVVILYRPAAALANTQLNGYFELCERLAREGSFLDLPVQALGQADAEQLARAALGGSATEESVTFVAGEAQGVPIFIEQLAHYVSKQEPAALGTDITLEDAITTRVAALNADQRAIVEVVAVANNPLPQSIVFEAAGLDAGALSSLLTLRSANLINWGGAGADDVVWAYHDRIRESVVATLPPETQRAHHLALGRALQRRQGSPGTWVFDAARHLGAAEQLIVDPEERLAAARLHAEAGDFAREAAAYPLGFTCYEGGIALLGNQAWDQHYDLALRLYGGAVETAYLSAEWHALERRSAEVKAHAKSVMDQLVAWETEIDALAGRQQYAAALDAGCSALSSLGVELPRDPSEADVKAALEPTLAALNQIGIAGMRALPEVNDARVAAITRIQVRLSPVAYFGKPLLLPIIACNLITTSIDRGLSTATPYGLALFGIVLNTLEMFRVSHAWGQLALELLDRWPTDRRLETATRHILFNLVCNWVVPLHSTLDSLREVFDIGRQTGDYEYAGFAAHGFVHNSIYAGRPLEPLKKEALYLGDQLRAFGVNALHVHRPFEQLLKALTGDLADPQYLDDETFDEGAALAKAEADQARSSVCVLNLTIGLARFHFGTPEEASRRLEVARAHLDGAPSVWHPPTVHQYAALAAGASWHRTQDESERVTYRGYVEDSLSALRRLAELTPVNFAHRVSMVEAELLAMDGDRKAALEKLEQAAVQAQEGSWINDVALAHELQARWHDAPEAKKRSLRSARTAYAAWGASAKASWISEKIAALAPGG